MHQHPHFNLILHDDQELEHLLGIPITGRTTLHQWPLSCVEHIGTGDGGSWIYKSQWGPTVEAAFYAQARSPLLPKARILHQSENGHINMLFEYINAPRMEDLLLSEEEILTIGIEIIEKIAQIEGDPPCFLDFSQESSWQALMEQMLAGLRALVAQGDFKVTDSADVANLQKWAYDAQVVDALGRDPGLVHHDLTGNNIFVSPDGYRLVDWQRPIRGPRALDLSLLLESMGIQPQHHIERGVVWLMILLRIEWFTQCALLWFPAGRQIYDAAIARLVSLLA